MTPKGTRPRTEGRSGHLHAVGDPLPLPPPLMRDVREALRSGEPLDLLSFASTMVAVCDPRSDDPFTVRAEAPDRPELEDLVLSFVDVDRPETVALLAVVAALLDGVDAPSAGVGRARAAPGLSAATARDVRHALARRGAALPRWIGGLADVQVTGVEEMAHVLGDGDNVLVGLRIPPHDELSLVIYVDHNMGGVVKDAFAVPDRLDGLVDQMRRAADDEDMSWRTLDPAAARARLQDAIDSGARTWPPFETDTWPACRPLVEWGVRLLPEGATYEGPTLWSDDDTARLADDFLSSPEGARHRPRARRGMLDALLWYGTGYGKCDPLRWSPVSVEIVLTDWVPRKISAPERDLRLVPDVLRDLVRYGHGRLGIRADLTEQTLDAVDGYEPAYLAMIRAPRAQGVDAIVGAMRAAGAFGDADPDAGAGDDLGAGGFLGDAGGDLDAEIGQIMLDSLARQVGGADLLRSLDDRPLPDEPLVTSGVPDDVAELVDEVSALCDGWWSGLGLDDPGVVELRTATRRLLELVAERGPDGLRRRAKVTGTAAAVCWAVASANEVFDGRPGSPRASELSAHFGVSGSPSTRARTLLRDAGLASSSSYGPVSLPTPLLTSARRSAMIASRDRWL